MKHNIAKFAALAGITFLAGCGAPAGPGTFVHDPYQQTNRAMHEVNKTVDTALLRPAAQVYDAATPTLVKHLTSNVLDMLDLPGDAANHFLQGNVMASLRTVGRLGLNIVMGAGVLDPATEMGLPKEDTDFGMTLASLGVNEGAYLEVPFLGPMTERGLAGRILDSALNPLSYVSGIPAGVGAASTGVGVVVARHKYFDAIDRIYYESEDGYIAARTTYLQLRRRAVAGEATAESLPDVFAE
ncbi:MAG: phospholipid-binding lipoprotein MlaA [Paracoccaceae bacterium]|jgi:phospholipid-binding lipoprotein MlaA